MRSGRGRGRNGYTTEPVDIVADVENMDKVGIVIDRGVKNMDKV